jgi:hypothetical protein
MERTGNMSYTELAEFLVRTLPDPTEGLILDAIKEAGGNDDDAQQALEGVRDWIDSPQIDSVEDTSLILDEGRDPDTAFEPDLDQGQTLEEIVQSADDLLEPEGAEPAIGVGDMPRDLPDETEKEPGDPIEEPMLEEQELEPEKPQMSGEEVMGAISEMIDEDPTTTNEDIKRRLQAWGIPGDDIAHFMNGLEQLRTSHATKVVISHWRESNVSVAEAAQLVMKLNPEMKVEDLRQALANAGVSEIEIDEALEQLPPQQMEDPMAMMPEEVGQDWVSRAQELVANDPMMTPEEIMEILQGEGASPEEAQAAADAAAGGGEPLGVGDMASTPRGAARIAHIHETLSGDLYQVVHADNTIGWYGEGAISRYKPEKTSSNNLWAKIASHMEEEWYTEMKVRPTALKSGYEQRIEASEALRQDVLAAMKTAAPEDETELARVEHALANEIDYCKAKVANSFNDAEAEYLVNLPTFDEHAAHQGSSWGPDGGAFAIAAAEAERDFADIDWNYEVTAGADLFVEDVAPNLIADSGEVRRMAARYITAKTAPLQAKDREPLVKQFVQNVERARKAAAIEARKTASTKEAVELPDNFEKGLFF